jgi:hypothetical protein
MTLTADSQEIPVRIVGSSVFGIHETISVERSYNFYISSSGDGEEEWLVNFPGFKGVLELIDTGVEGRGFYHSVRGGFLLAVAGAAVYKIDTLAAFPTQLGTIGSSTGEVFIDENLSGQVAIVDGLVTYIYNYILAPATIVPAVYTNVPIDTIFNPNYVTYQNTYFIFGNSLTTANGSQWVVFEQNLANSDHSLKWVQTLTLQTKPDFAKAVLRIPGKGNNVIVIGSTVAELWNNVGGLQVYQRNSSINIDFGVASVSTIAANDEVVAWLGINEKSSPAIMAMKGGAAARISTDGIDNLLQKVNKPASSTAFLFRVGGHNFYVLTFIDPSDDFSIMYDFTTNKFFDVTDWNMTAFPARQIVYFGNKSYFISYKDGKIYEIGVDLTTYQYLPNASSQGLPIVYDMPCVRLTNTFRLPRPEKVKINLFTFTVESGTTAEIFDDTHLPRVDLTISKNGGLAFSDVVSYDLKRTGKFQNQPRFINLGYAQQITYEMRIWSKGRKVLKNGIMEIGG